MKPYGIDDAKVIIRDFGEKWVEFKSDGVHLRGELFQYDTSQVLHWKYVCELEDSDSPNPLTAPSLPFPFTANELTAFMLDGVGAVIASNYGNWEDGPDQGMLDSMGVLSREPRRAITDAYAAYMSAQATVGSYPTELQKRASRLCKIYSYRNLKANKREGVFAAGISQDEANGRRGRAVASNAELEKRYDLATKEYQAASGAWRKAMVNQLLKLASAQSTPAPEIATEALADQTVTAGQVPPPRDKPTRKPRVTWRDLAWDYVVETYSSRPFKTAHTFYVTLVNKVGKETTPFTLHERELFLKDIGQAVAEKTIKNNMKDIKKAAICKKSNP